MGTFGATTIGSADRRGAAGLRVRAEATRQHTIWVLSVALATRVGVVWYAMRHFGSGWFYTRGLEMGLLAQSLLDGRGLSSPFGVPTGPTAMIAPGYPLLVAAVFWVFGSYSAASALALMGINLALNLATVWLIIRLARGIADERSAVLAGAFWACSLPTMWAPTIFWETNLSAAMLLGLVAIVMKLRGKHSLSHWFGAGVFVGLAGLVNPALLPCMGGILLCGGWSPGLTSARRLTFAALGFLLVFSAWPIRNAQVFGRFIPTRTTVGFELWMGNREGATGFLEETRFPTFHPGELADYKAMGEVAYMNRKGEMARAYIRAHAGPTLRLTALRVGRFWLGRGTRGGSIFFMLHALMTTVLGAIGLFWLRRTGDRWTVLLFLLPIALFPLPYYVTHAEFRYRLVLDPVLCVLAAGGWTMLCGWRDGTLKKMA